MISLNERNAVELPVVQAFVHGSPMQIQRWSVGSIGDAQALYKVIAGLVGDDPDVAAILLDPKGREGKPLVTVLWRGKWRGMTPFAIRENGLLRE